MYYREPADEMQTTKETADTNETNNASTVDASRLDVGAIQNENVSLMQLFAGNMIYGFVCCFSERIIR